MLVPVVEELRDDEPVEQVPGLDNVVRQARRRAHRSRGAAIVIHLKFLHIYHSLLYYNSKPGAIFKFTLKTKLLKSQDYV